MSIAITTGGIYLNYNKPELWNFVEFLQYDDYYMYGTVGLMGLRVLAIICATFGMYGGCYKKKYPISIYQLGIIILFVLFLGIGVVLIIIFIPFYLDLKNDMDCTSDKNMQPSQKRLVTYTQFYSKYIVFFTMEKYIKEMEKIVHTLLNSPVFGKINPDKIRFFYQKYTQRLPTIVIFKFRNAGQVPSICSLTLAMEYHQIMNLKIETTTLEVEVSQKFRKMLDGLKLSQLYLV